MKPQKVYQAITRERLRQEEKFGPGKGGRTCADPAMPDLEKLAVLLEEVGEVAHELTEQLNVGKDITYELIAELVQVAAVSVAWLESLEDPDE